MLICTPHPYAMNQWSEICILGNVKHEPKTNNQVEFTRLTSQAVMKKAAL